MDEKRFEELWQRAEAEGYASKMAAEFPAWRSARRRTAGIATGLAMAVIVAVPALNHIQPSEQIYCNNPAFSNSHWTEMASTLLMES